MKEYKSKTSRLPTVKYNPDDLNPWVTYFRNRIFKKNNCINCVVTGLPGEGKSWACLAQALAFDPNFDQEKQLFFSAVKMFEAFDNPEFFAKPGKIIIFDEAGSDFKNINWRDAFNQTLRDFLQTGRFRNYVLMVNAPFLTDISKGSRVLMNCHWKAMGWKDNKTRVAPRVMEFYDIKDKFYFKRLRVLYPNEIRLANRRIGVMKIRRPPATVTDPYEKRKLENYDMRQKENIALIKMYEAKQKQERQNLGRPYQLTYLQEELLVDLKDGLTVGQVAAKNKCGEMTVYGRIQDLRKKGIKITSRLIDSKSEGFIVEMEANTP